MTEEKILYNALVVDDEDIMRNCVAEIVADMGFKTSMAADSSRAFEVFMAEKPALAVVDLKMPGADGIDFLNRIKKSNIECQVIIMTGYASRSTEDEVLASGAFGFLKKPFELNEIRSLIRDAQRNLRNK